MQRYGIYIGNVDRSVTLDQLKVVFGPCGNIVDSSMNGSAENAYRFAFMDFASDEERQHALRLNGINLANRDLKVAPSKGVNQPGNNAERGPRHQQQAGMGGAPQYGGHHQQQMGGGYPPQQYGGGYPPQGYPMQPPPQQPSPQVIQSIIATMQAAGQLRPGQEPTQQQLQAIATAAIAVQQPQHQQPPPHMMMGGGYPGGAYPHPQQQQPMMPMGRGAHPHHTPANPPPTMEELALRAKQREQYLGKLRSEGERYETKIKKLLARGRGEATAGGSGSDSSSSDSSSESDDNDAPKNQDDQINNNNNNIDNNHNGAVDHFNEQVVVVGEKRPREEDDNNQSNTNHTEEVHQA